MKNEYPELNAKIDKAINYFLEDLGTIRAGRANASVLNKVSVDYYGTQTPVSQVAAIATPDARTITIQPWDASLLKEIEKAILKSEIGITPANDGKVIRLAFPTLTEERRKEFVKVASKKAEEARVAVRSIRRDAMEFYKKQQKASEITEDDLKGIEKDIQELTDKYIKKIDDEFKLKEKEILAI